MICKVCFCSELKPHYYQEPLNSNTPIGLCWDDKPEKASIDYLYCPKCGLMYQPIEEEKTP